MKKPMENQQQVEEKVKTKTNLNVFLNTKNLVATAILLIMTGGLFAYAGISQGGLLMKNKVSRVSTRSETITFSVTAPELNKEIIEKDGIKYTRLSYVDEDKLLPETEGVPEVPYLVKTVAIPDSAQNITVTTNSTTENVVTEDIAVYPVPKQIAHKGEDGKVDGFDEEFYKDEAAYTIDAFQPTSTTEKGEDFYFRSQHLLSIKVSPLAFNSKTKQLQIIPTMDVTVSYTVNLAASSKKNTLTSLAKMLKNTVANPEAVTAADSGQVKATSNPVLFLTQAQLRSVSNNVDYLIITHTDFYSTPELSTFANYRKNNDNFNVAVANVADIYNEFTGADNVEKIKAFTQYAYDHWAVVPEYLLLMGDLEWVPAYHSNQDEYIAYVSGGDEYVDMAVGRLPVRNAVEITNVYNKIFHYENDPVVAGDYHEQAGLFHNGTCTTLDGEIDLENHLFNVYHNCYATRLDVINNFAKNYVTYFAHGGERTWVTYGTPWFSLADLNTLTNRYKNPFIYNGGCLTACMSGEYCTNSPPPNPYSPHCIGEALVVMPEKGAVGYIGNPVEAEIRTWRNMAHQILEHFQYRAGYAAIATEGNVYIGQSSQGKILFSDPALHLLGQRAGAGESDLVTNNDSIGFNREQHKIWVRLTNLGSSDAVNPPVEAYNYDNPLSPVYLGTATDTGTVPAFGTLDVYIPVPDDTVYGGHMVLIKINPSSNPSHTPESYELNNQYPKNINLEPIPSVVTVTNNGSPVQNAGVTPYDNNGNLLPGGGTTNAEGVALVAVNKNQVVHFHVSYGMGNCFATETEICGAPCNQSVSLPLLTHYDYLDQNNNLFSGRVNVDVYDASNNYICMFTSGSSSDLYIKPGLEVRFEVSSSDDPYSNGCLSDIQFCTTPCNITLHQPIPTHFTYKDSSGSNVNATAYAYGDQTRQKTYCSMHQTGSNLYLKKGLKVMFEATKDHMTYVWTPLVEAPYEVTICEAGDCCIDGTALSGCSAIKEWCNPQTFLPEKNCLQCGYTCQSDQTCMPSGVCATGTKKVNPEETP
ncbi:MAG: C25 family cysteine peptidase [Planctomycetota bacterium]